MVPNMEHYGTPKWPHPVHNSSDVPTWPVEHLTAELDEEIFEACCIWTHQVPWPGDQMVTGWYSLFSRGLVDVKPQRLG